MLIRWFKKGLHARFRMNRVWIYILFIQICNQLEKQELNYPHTLHCRSDSQDHKGISVSLYHLDLADIHVGDDFRHAKILR